MSEQDDSELLYEAGDKSFAELSDATEAVDGGEFIDISVTEDGSMYVEGDLVPDEIASDAERLAEYLQSVADRPEANGHRPMTNEETFRRLLRGGR